MLLTLDDCLEVVASQLPHELVSPAALARIRSLARRLPPLTMAGFECPLQTEQPGADFAVAVRPGMGDRELLVRWLAEAPAAGRAPDTRAWDRLRDFCTRWADPTSEIYDAVGTVWLEYDAAGSDTDSPVPNVLVGLMQRPGMTRDDSLRVAELALELLLGGPLPVGIAHNLALCHSALPPEGALFQVGVMLGRNQPGVRACVATLPTTDIGAYLARIGWPGPVDELAGLLGPLTTCPVQMALGLDVGPVILPRIGVEYYPEWERRPWLDPRWTALLDHLVAAGLCTPQKHDTLLAWPGRTYARFLWTSTFLRGLNHVKLVYQPGSPLSAKAYFGFAQT